MIKISRRDVINIRFNKWMMQYYPSGDYFIYDKDKKVAQGRYDAVIADSYNTQMSKEDQIENLKRDLISWVEKAINGEVSY